MKFYKYIIEKDISADDVVLILKIKHGEYFLSNENRVLLKTKDSDDIWNLLKPYINHDPNNILKVVKKVGKISFVANKNIYNKIRKRK